MATATKTKVKAGKARAERAPQSPGTPAHAGTANLRPWVKGQSGNPKGRPKDVESVARLAREHSAEAVHRIVALMRQEEEPKVALQAAMHLLDRGIGKTLSTKTINHELGDTAADFITALREISRRPRLDLIEGELVELAPPTEDPA